MSAPEERPQAVLFDIDGTLISTGGAGARSWAWAFDNLYGHPVDIGKFTDAGMTDPVVARKTFRCRAWDLGVALDWAADRAASLDFAGVTVACEPTGHRWRVLGQLAADRGMALVCVQPMVSLLVSAGGGSDRRQDR